jgi:flavodoxin
MKVEVRYFSRGGNTRKLAEAAGEAAGVQAKTVDTPVSEKIDVLFLGSSVYAAGVDEAVKKFIASLDPEKVGQVYCFSTAALLPSTYNQVSKLLKEKGIAVSEKEFHCRGSFAFMHKGHPDADDLARMKAFVKDVCA